MIEEEKKNIKSKPVGGVGRLTPGDYTIHVLIQKSKDLALPESSVSTVLVEICSGRDHEYTKDY